MKVTLCLYVLVLLSTACPWPKSEAARILAVCAIETPSHFFLVNRLVKELAGRGHEVTMVSPFPQKTPVRNFRDVVLKDMKQVIHEFMSELQPGNKQKVSFLDYGSHPPWVEMIHASLLGARVTEKAMEQESFQNLLSDPNEKFDLVIFQMFRTEILYGLAHKYNAPVIVLSTFGSSQWTNHLVGNPAPNSYVPYIYSKTSSHMNLVERIFNTAVNLYGDIYRRFVFFPQLDVTLHKFFPDAPPIYDLMYNKTAMILLNSHPSISDPKPHVPAMVEIGGFHVEDAKPLPKDLKDYMDNATYGVILFSMGSNMKSTEMDNKTRNSFLKVFGKLKQKVIWKWEDDNLPGKPANVKIMKWFPQNDIMAHPNLRLFMTHGGILSITEAVYHGVPIIGFPIFGDQKMNVAMTKQKGYGLSLDLRELTEEKLSATLNEILSNPNYKMAARKASQLLRGQPMNPLDAAVFWVNHVIQHKGASHFRSAAMDLNWFQLYSVDIALLTLLAMVAIFTIFYYTCKKLCRRKTIKDLKDSSKKMN